MKKAEHFCSAFFGVAGLPPLYVIIYKSILCYPTQIRTHRITHTTFERYYGIHYRKIFKGTYIINRGFTKELADQAIKNNVADLISFGEPFISNPDLVKRFELSVPLQIADKQTFYTTGEKGYTDYPFYSNLK